MNTTHDDHPDPTVNPLVSEMLAAGKDETTSIEGFVGKVEAGMVRIYANLGLNHYIEVPEAGLVRVVEGRDPKEPAVLILRRDVPITYVQTHHRAGISVSQSITTSIDALSAIDIGDVKAAHDCGCGPVPAQAMARQSGGGPEGVDLYLELPGTGAAVSGTQWPSHIAVVLPQLRPVPGGL